MTEWEQLATEYGAQFHRWQGTVDRNRAVFERCPINNCSVFGHQRAAAFTGWLQQYMALPLLDIGCGPQPLPSYLAGLPYELLAGLDPLVSEHPFAFQCGVAEQMPYADTCFATVVAASSLDHCFDIPRALREVSRVLVPDGVFIVWVDTHQVGADAYHLMRYDHAGWLQLFQPLFVVEAQEVGYDDAFFALRNRCLATSKSIGE
tara:strand:- start:1402 stop:2016 length:615 start_codon:yes stop_codon:yes gene_type:complete